MRWLLNAFLQGLLKSAYGNVVFSRSKLHALHKSLVFFRTLLLPAVPNLMFCVFFPGKGWGPGFSLCCRPSALTAPWNWGRVGFFCMHFYRVVWIWGDFCMHFYRVCWIPLMGMSCVLVQNCTHFTKVSCFSIHFLLPAVANVMFCVFLHVLYICVWFCAYVLQFVAGSSWVELIF